MTTLIHPVPDKYINDMRGNSMNNSEYGRLELHIEELLQQRGISKNTLCKTMDIPRSNLNRYCRNEFERLDATFICKLLYFLQCPLDELITYEDSRSAD